MIEVLLALIVLSLASVAVITGFMTTISASSEHRSLATFNTVLRSATETAISQIQGNGAVTFNPCATPSYYQTGPGAVSFANISPTGTNYSAQITGVAYWTGTIFSSSVSDCVAANDAPQQITLTATNNDNQTTYSNSFVVDNSVAVPLLPLCVAPNCTPTHLVFATSPAGATANNAFSTQPVVWAVTAFNTIARHDASTINLNISAGTGASGANVLNSCQGSETSGVTSFFGCGIDLGSSNTYTLTATDGSLVPATSSPFYNYTQLTTPVITAAVPDSATPGGLDVGFSASSPSAGVQSYTAEICTDPGLTLGCVTKTSYTSGSMIPGVIGMSYYAQITALATNGYLGSTSAIYGPTAVTNGPRGAPGTPSLAYGLTAGSLQVAFGASTPQVGGQTYSAEACTGAGMTGTCFTQNNFVSGGQFTGLHFSAGQAGTPYYVTVTANAVTGYTQSPPSSTSTPHPDTSQVNAPINVIAGSGGSSGQLTVSFTTPAGSGLASDSVQYCTSPGGGCNTVNNFTSGSHINNLNRHGRYYVTVIAQPQAGYVSASSNQVSGNAG